MDVLERPDEGRDALIVTAGWRPSLVRALGRLQVRQWSDLQHVTRAEVLKSPSVGLYLIDFLEEQMAAHGVAFKPHTPASRRLVAFDAPEVSHCVYFIRCQEFVKIGRATRLRSRLSSLATSCPFPIVLLALIHVESVGAASVLEAQLHERFTAVHHRNEWFRYEAPIVQFIRTLLEQPARQRPESVEECGVALS